MKISPKIFSFKTVELELATECQLSSCIKSCIIRIVLFTFMVFLYFNMIGDKSSIYIYFGYLGLFSYTVILILHVVVLINVYKKLQVMKGDS